MTFLHKLAQRLARLKLALIIGLLAALACEHPVAVLNTALRVASLNLSPAVASVPVGRAVQLIATLRDSSGAPLTGRTLTWLSSNLNVAAVDGGGLVTGQSPGASTITAVSDGVSGTAALTVTNIPVASVTVAPATASISPGQTWQLTATPKDANGNALTGRVVTWASSATGVATVSVSGVVTGVAAGLVTITATSEGQSGTSAVTVSVVPVATVTVSPAAPSVQLGQTVQLTATPKDANGYVLTGRVITWTSSATGVATVSALGLVTSVAVGSTTITATSEGVNGTAVVTVTVPPPPPSGGVVMQSDWTTALGNSDAAIRDGGRWDDWADWGGAQLLSVVAGGPTGYANALRVQQRGPNYAARVQRNAFVTPSQDFYIRFYMRNDDVSSTEDHIVSTIAPPDQADLIYVTKSGGASSWSFRIRAWSCAYTYPISSWAPSRALTNGQWYRLEFYVHFTDATHVQVHPRVYDATGALYLSDADFRQEDYGAATWNGRSDWTLASFAAAGYSTCLADPVRLTYFSMGNNGQAGSSDTGRYWYYAGLQVRTDTWPGP